MKRTFILVSILISYLIGNSQPAKNGLFDQSSVKVSEIRSNTIRSDFGPAIIGDSIYFSSFRDEVMEKSDKELKEKEFYDLYKAAIDVYKVTFDKDIDYLQEVVVVNSKTRKPIPGAMVNFCDKKSGMTGIDGMISQLFKKNSVCNTTASALGYKDNKLTISIGTPKSGVILRDTIPLEMVVNEKIVLKNIYYDFDRWDILPESAIELDRLISFTKENPEMKVELGSHTDARGSQQYNLRLSELRAQAAVNYIVSKGIDKSNVKGIGYGESQPINICTSAQPCTSAQQRENRRTELFIPGYLTSEPVKQDIGDYSDGRSDHGRNYSSYKQHGSIFSTTASGIGTDAGAYYLILGSFKDTVNAGKFVQQLKVDGFEATVLTDSEPVRVGNKYQFYGQAKRALDTLKSKSYIGWIIQGN